MNVKRAGLWAIATGICMLGVIANFGLALFALHRGSLALFGLYALLTGTSLIGSRYAESRCARYLRRR